MLVVVDIIISLSRRHSHRTILLVVVAINITIYLARRCCLDYTFFPSLLPSPYIFPVAVAFTIYLFKIVVPITIHLAHRFCHHYILLVVVATTTYCLSLLPSPNPPQCCYHRPSCPALLPSFQQAQQYYRIALHSARRLSITLPWTPCSAFIHHYSLYFPQQYYRIALHSAQRLSLALSWTACSAFIHHNPLYSLLGVYPSLHPVDSARRLFITLLGVYPPLCSAFIHHCIL